MASAQRIPHDPARAPRRPGAGLLAAGSILLAALWPRPAAAAPGVTRMVVPVRGMTCVLCTRGVEESIKRLEGVGVVLADLEAARVQVEALPGKTLNIQQVKDGVLRAGFGIGGEISLFAPGRFAVGPEGRIVFRITGTAMVYQVLESGQLLRLFKRHPGLKGEFLVNLRLHDHPHWKPPAISILSFEPRPLPVPPAAR